MDEQNKKALFNLGKEFTHPDFEEKKEKTTLTVEERLEQLEQYTYELTENVFGGLESIRWMLKHIRDSLYPEPLPEDANQKYDVDLSLEELQDSIDWIDTLMNGEEEEEEE